MALFQSALFSSPEGNSFNSAVPMSFRTGMKIVLTDDAGTDAGPMYYDVDYTLGDQHGGDMLYFHAYFHRDNTKLDQAWSILIRLTSPPTSCSKLPRSIQRGRLVLLSFDRNATNVLC